MKKLDFIIVPFIILFSFPGCTQVNEKGKTPDDKAKEKGSYVDGKDYYLLKRFRVTDNQGFNKPVEAFSILLPANWQVKSSLQWNGTSKCMVEILQASLTATSPDGEYELMMLPVTQFDWSDDSLTLDAMQRGGFLYSCRLQQPMDAAVYIKNELAPYLKATVANVQSPQKLQAAMQQGAIKMKQAATQAGNDAYNYNPSAAEATLNFADGKEGMTLVTLMQTIVTTPGAFSQQIQTVQCYVSMRLVMKHPAGKAAKAKQLLGTVISSTRANPEWVAAVQKTFQAIQQGAQNTLGQIIEITSNSQREISDNINRSWEKKESSDDNTRAWSEYIRGVDSWVDGDGNKVELSSGYSQAWSRGDGTYLLTNNTSFNPNIEFQENWSALKK